MPAKKSKQKNKPPIVIATIVAGVLLLGGIVYVVLSQTIYKQYPTQISTGAYINTSESIESLNRGSKELQTITEREKQERERAKAILDAPAPKVGTSNDN